MAKYERTRTYVVSSFIEEGSFHKTQPSQVGFSAPKGRAYADIFIRTSDLPKRMLKSLKVGKKVTFTRFSTPYTTYFGIKA